MPHRGAGTTGGQRTIRLLAGQRALPRRGIVPSGKHRVEGELALDTEARTAWRVSPPQRRCLISATPSSRASTAPTTWRLFESRPGGIELFAAEVPRGGRWTLNRLPQSLSPDDSEAVVRGCYEMLMVLAAAVWSLCRASRLLRRLASALNPGNCPGITPSANPRLLLAKG